MKRFTRPKRQEGLYPSTTPSTEKPSCNLPNPGKRSLPGFKQNPENPKQPQTIPKIVSKQNPRSKHKPSTNYTYRYIYLTKNNQSKAQKFETNTPTQNAQNQPKSNHPPKPINGTHRKYIHNSYTTYKIIYATINKSKEGISKEKLIQTVMVRYERSEQRKMMKGDLQPATEQKLR